MQNRGLLSPFSYEKINDKHKVLNSFVKHTTASKFIKKVGVIGAGVMGSGIAAVLANSSIEVILLDIPSKDPKNKNLILEQALEKLENSKPLSFTSLPRKDFIKIGNLEDDLRYLQDCDLIIEVIVEKLEVKWQLYEKIIPHLKNNAILASNTSTLQLKQLKQNLPENLKLHFMIIHFFNPPRYMELVELITDTETDPHAISNIKDFITHTLGKTIVECNDTPGFIANRIGCFLLELVVRKAIEEKLDPTIIDNIFAHLFKLPSTGIFGLYDLIGLDVLELISSSLIKHLNGGDLYKQIYLPTPLIDNMIKVGSIGRKSGGGFYQMSEVKGKKEKRAISFADLDSTTDENWQPQYIKSTAPKEIKEQFSSLEELFNSSSPYGKFFKEITFKFYYYLFSLIPDVTGNISDIDLAMELGYSWKMGPFKLLATHIPGGVNWILKEAKDQGLEFVNINSNKLLKAVEDLKSVSSKSLHTKESEIFSNDSARLYSYKNNLVISIESKMNCLNNELFDLFLESVNYAEKQKKDLFIYSPDSPNFSAGADLKFIINCIETKDFDSIDKFIKLGQKALMRLKHASINVIACAQGAALGGGCEILLHSDFVVAHSELKAGLVEMSVGLIPGWGGCKEMFLRSKGNVARLVQGIQNIIYENRSASADQFINDYSIQNHMIVMHKNDLFTEGHKLKLPQKVSPLLDKIILPQIDLSPYFETIKLDEFQQNILASFQKLINLKVITTKELLEFEREKFVELCKRPEVLPKLKAIVG